MTELIIIPFTLESFFVCLLLSQFFIIILLYNNNNKIRYGSVVHTVFANYVN